MSRVTTIHKDGEPIYNIYLNPDFNGIPNMMDELSLQSKKICIVTDSRVEKHYLNEVENIMGDTNTHIHTFVFEEGEERKNLDTITQLYRKLIEYRFERGDALVALGGGVVGDMTGFAAATFLRGIRFIQIPTTLLAMVDSSIGGKTGVDVDGYKNMVGAFYQPSAVYVNLSVLNTLSKEHYFSGYGEIIKHALILDRKYLDFIKQNREPLLKRDLGCLEELVHWSNRIKQSVVESDPYEKKERVLLNFGHTLGHAIEKYMNFKYLHGQCVSLGMAAASFLSLKRGNIRDCDYQEVVNLLREFNLPIKIGGFRAEEVVELVKSDKKMKDGHIQFILLKQMGKAYIDNEVTDQEMRESLECLAKN